MDEGTNDMLTPANAAAYLASQWQRPFSSKDFTSFRWNNKEKLQKLEIVADYSVANLTLWRRTTLDKIVNAFPGGPEYHEDSYGKPRATEKLHE